MKTKSITFVGDTITSGTGTTPGNSFASLCKANFPKTFPEYSWTLSNLGKPGATSDFWLNGTGVCEGAVRQREQKIPALCTANNFRWIEEFPPKAYLKEAADITVFMLGTNDCAPGGIPLYDFTIDMLEMLVSLVALGKQVVLMTPPVLHEKYWTGGRSNKVLAEYADAIRNLAAANKLPLVDNFANFLARSEKINEYFQPNKINVNGTDLDDGIHPNDAGHKLIYDALLAVIKSILLSPVPKPPMKGAGISPASAALLGSMVFCTSESPVSRRAALKYFAGMLTLAMIPDSGASFKKLLQ